MHELAIDVVRAIAVYAALGVLQLLLRRVRFVRQIGISLNLLFLCVALHAFLADELAALHPYVRDGLLAALLTLAIYVGIRICDVWLFDRVLRRRRRRQVPAVVRDILRWLLIAVAFFFILRTIFPNLDLNILAVSSLVVGYIVGNATQDTLGNLISGLALNTEDSFSIGDWVTIGGHTGRIVEMTWRATRMRTKMNDHIIIPNSAIAREPIVNYSRPTVRHGFTLELGVSYEVPPNTVRRVILSVLDSLPEVLSDPRPRIWLTTYNDFSIDYTIKFFITDFENLENIQSDVMYLIWYHFKREGIVIPFPIRDVRMSHDAPTVAVEPDTADFDEYKLAIQNVDLFEALTEEERALVASNVRQQIYSAGERLVRQGEEGHTFYIIRSGAVRVTVLAGGQDSELKRLGPGDFFGEMSLLTGEKRSATVTAVTDTHVLVLSHHILGRLLKDNASLAGELAKALETRRASQRWTYDQRERENQEQARPEDSHTVLVRRIRRFFGLSG